MSEPDDNTPIGRIVSVTRRWRDPANCPRSIDGCACPACGGELEHGYGFASGYGLGSYKLCEDCGEYCDFVEDMD